MIALRTCIAADSPVLAALWNVKTLDEQSCWYQAAQVTAAYITGLMSAGYTLVIAEDNQQPLGFGVWCGPLELPRLVALAADDTQVYYHLMLVYCNWAIAAGAVRGFAEIDARPTSERARMDALEIITYRPVGFEPLPAGASSEDRVARLFWAECELSILQQRLVAELEEPS